MDSKKIASMMLIAFMFAVFLGRIYHEDVLVRGEQFEVYTSYHNTGSEKAKNMKVTVYIPDIGLYERSNTFDIAAGDNDGRFLLPYISNNAQAGWHRMWIILSSDSQRDYMYDWVYIQ